MLTINQKTEPATLPVSRDDLAKLQIRVDGTDEDVLLDVYLGTATKLVQQHTHQRFVTQQVEICLDSWGGLTGFPYFGIPQTGVTIYNDIFKADYVLLPLGPLISVDSVEYLDSGGNTQTWDASNYVVSVGKVGRIGPKQGRSFPQTANQIDAIKITCTVGYGTINDVPDDVKNVILCIFATSYRHRTAGSERDLHEVPFQVKAMLDAIGTGLNLFA